MAEPVQVRNVCVYALRNSLSHIVRTTCTPYIVEYQRRWLAQSESVGPPFYHLFCSGVRELHRRLRFISCYVGGLNAATELCTT